MSGSIQGNNSASSGLEVSPSDSSETTSPDESVAEKKFGRFLVSKVDVDPKVSQADPDASEAGKDAPEKKIDIRRVARQSVLETKIRLSKSQTQIVKSLLNRGKNASDMGRFEKRFMRKIIAENRKKGINKTDSMSKYRLRKSIKKAVKLNVSLIQHRGKAVVKAQEDVEKKPVKSTPHTDVSGLSDFNQLTVEDQDNINSHVMLGAAAYKGFDPDLVGLKIPSDCTLLSRDELPVELQMLYDDQTGLIHSPDNAKAFVVRKGDDIVLAFAGTESRSAEETGRSGTVKTDVTQRLGISSPMYRSAAAVLDLLLSHKPLSNAKVSVAGHSLGGGLAQFAYTAMQGRHDPNRLVGAITINPAGLSQGTLNQLGDERINMAKKSIQNIRIKGDPVSPSGRRKAGLTLKGNLVGSIMTLPDPEKRGVGVHSSDVAIDVLEFHMAESSDKIKG